MAKSRGSETVEVLKHLRAKMQSEIRAKAEEVAYLDRLIARESGQDPIGGLEQPGRLLDHDRDSEDMRLPRQVEDFLIGRPRKWTETGTVIDHLESKGVPARKKRGQVSAALGRACDRADSGFEKKRAPGGKKRYLYRYNPSPGTEEGEKLL